MKVPSLRTLLKFQAFGHTTPTTQVLPGRQFPAFSEGDTGVVKRVDAEVPQENHDARWGSHVAHEWRIKAGTCDVLFDHNIVLGSEHFLKGSCSFMLLIISIGLHCCNIVVYCPHLSAAIPVL